MTSGEGRAGEIVQFVIGDPRVLIVGVAVNTTPTVPEVIG
jgi:hypothetical protein